MLIFLDTEFTNFAHPSLISLGLVADSSEEFYAEVPYPDRECSAFVREAVIPLLGREPNAAMSKDDLYGQVFNWLKLVRSGDEEVDFCIDYQTDWDLFLNAMDYRLPIWCRMRMIAENLNELLRYEFYMKNGLPEHHALYDARAHRYAFRERVDVTCDRTTRK